MSGAGRQGRGLSRLADKRSVLALGVLGALVVLVASRPTWVEGTVVGAAGETAARATGAEAAPGLVGIALVGAAAAVAAVTAGRVGRVVAVVVLGLVALAVAVLAGRVLADPSGVLGSVAGSGAGAVGTSGEVDATGAATAWPWVADVAALLFALAALGAAVGGRGWRALGEGGSRRATDRHATGSDWDRLTEGDDPTERDGAGERPGAG